MITTEWNDSYYACDDKNDGGDANFFFSVGKFPANR